MRLKEAFLVEHSPYLACWMVEGKMETEAVSMTRRLVAVRSGHVKVMQRIAEVVEGPRLQGCEEFDAAHSVESS